MPGLNDMFSSSPWQVDSYSSPETEGGAGGYGATPWNWQNTQGVDWASEGWDGPTSSQNMEGDWSTNPEFASWLTSKGYQPGSYQPQAGNPSLMQGVLKGGQLMPGSSYYNNINDSTFWNAAMLAGSTVASPMLTSSLGSAGAGATMGAGSSFMSGGSLGDVIKAGAAGGVAGGYSPDVAGYTGAGDGVLGNTINGAAKGGLQALLSGGKPIQGAAMGGAVSGLNSLGATQEYGYSRAPWATGNSPSFSEGASYGSSPAPWAAPSTQFRSTEEDQGGGGLTDFLGKLIPEQLQTKQGLGDLAQGLAGIYSGYKRRGMAKDLMNRIGGNRDSYLANLRGQLQARDAKSGKRSNYAGREVELQAKLAELDSRNAPALASFSDARSSGLEQMLGAGLRMGGRMGAFGSQYERPQTMQPMQPYNYTAPTMPAIQDQTAMLDPSLADLIGRRGRVYGGY